MDETLDFFGRVKAWCKEHKTTIEALMQDASGGEWTKAVYFGWRKGDSLPKGENIARLAAYMGVSCDWLITGKESGKADLTAAEQDMVRIYRKCDAATQMRIDAYLEGIEAALPPQKRRTLAKEA
ncbi:MAG: helix-turn-helix transcriptional regulator [Treponema sp.]|nr:helix-turn-helix transcriptional regulator [Treponema sp.]